MMYFLYSIFLFLFPLSAFSQHHFVFDLSGSFHGSGDVTGPLWTIIELRKNSFPDQKTYPFTVLVDDRAESILLETLFKGSNLTELGKKWKLKFVDQSKASEIEKADYSFQLFVGGRKVHDLTQLIYTQPSTVTLISNTMHEEQLDELREGDRHLYFKPPGVGEGRSGLVNDPLLKNFQSHKEKESSFQMLADRKNLQEVIHHAQNQKAILGFFYGVHNEIIDLAYQGQTRSYIQALVEHSERKNRSLVFATPNTLQELIQAGVDPKQIFSVEEFLKLAQKGPLPDWSVLSLGAVSSQVFFALLSLSELPVLVEGNSAMSTAIRLGKYFLMYRSPWNKTQIFDLIQLEKKKFGSDFFKSVYSSLEDQKGSKVILPQWSLAFEHFSPFSPKNLEKQAVFFGALNKAVPNLYRKFDFLIHLDLLLKKKERDEKWSLKPVFQREHLYEEIGGEIAATEDPYLWLSFFMDGHKRGLISQEFYTKKKKHFVFRAFSEKEIEEMEKKFIPVIPRHSEKIEFFERIEISQLDDLKSALENLLRDQSALKNFSSEELVVLLVKSFAHPALQDQVMQITRLLSQERLAEVSLSFLNFYLFHLDARKTDLENQFQAYLRWIDKAYPQFKLFEHYFQNRTENVFDLGGLKFLLEFFKQEKKQYAGKLSQVRVVHLDELQQNLSEVIQNFSQKPQWEFSFLVQSPRYGHFTALFMRKNEQGYQFLTTDTGRLEDGWVKDLVTKILEVEELQNEQKNGIQFFSFFQHRQWDLSSCPIISFRDILENSKKSLFGYLDRLLAKKPNSIKENHFPEAKGHPSFLVDQLPVEWMKVVQNPKHLKAYLSSLSDEDKMSPVNCNNESCFSVLKKNTQIALIKKGGEQEFSPVEINFYTRKKAFKYFAIVLRKLIESERKIKENL